MKITGIKRLKKSLCALYLDGEYAVEIDRETLIESRFSENSEITDEELFSLLEESKYNRAKSKAIWLISQRDYSKKTLFYKLLRDHEEEPVKRAVERMEELGLLDDEEYARKYAKDLIEIKHLGLKGAKYKLMEKGIDKELAEQVLSEIETDPKEHIRLLIERKYEKDLHDEKGTRRAVSALMRKGYSWDDIKSVLEEFTEK